MKWHRIYDHFTALIIIVSNLACLVSLALAPRSCTEEDVNTWICTIATNNDQISCKDVDRSTYSSRAVTLKIQTIDLERHLMLFEYPELCNINRLQIVANHIPSNAVTYNLKSLEFIIIQNSGQSLNPESALTINNMFLNLNRLKKVKIENFKVTLWNKEIFQSCSEITEIDLKSLEIESIDFQSFINCKKLVTLIIRMNKIPRLLISSFNGLSELSKLSLQFNEITEIFTNGNSWEGMEKLKDLDFSDNKIVKLTPKLFVGLRFLERLSLKNNRINSIALDTFHGLDELTVLDLQNNLRLIRFDLNVLSPVKRSLTRIFIETGSIQCLHDKHHLPEYRKGVNEQLKSIATCNPTQAAPTTDSEAQLLSPNTIKSTNDVTKDQMTLIITMTIFITAIVFLLIFFIYCTVMSRSKVRKLKQQSQSNSYRYSRNDILSAHMSDVTNTQGRNYQNSEGTYAMFMSQTNSRNDNPKSETTSMVT